MMTHLTEFTARAADLAARALPLLGDGALRGTIVLAAAAGVTSLMRRSAAATRHLVWSTAVVGVLALPLLTLVAPRWSVPITAAQIAIPRLPASPRDTAALTDGNARLSLATDRAADPRPSLQQKSSAAPLPESHVDVPGPARRTDDEPDRAASRGGLSLTAWLALVWALGAVVVLLRLALGTLGLARLVRRATPADDPAWVMLLQRLARELGIRRPVTLLVGRTGTVPVTWGVVYPIVLLPADADSWSEERRRAVLLHELAHVERFDALTHVLSQLALALFWFHPLVTLAARRLRAERERACDDLVLAVGTRATSYADDLLELVQTLGEASPAAAALAMARRSEFEGRLLAILDPALPRARTTRRAAAVACALTAVAVVPLAGARPAAPARSASAPPPTAPSASRSAPPPSYIALHGPTQPHAPNAPAVGSPSTLTALGLTSGRTAPAAPLAPSARVQPSGCPTRAGRHVSINTDGERSTTIVANGERCLEVRVDGRVDFNDDDTDVERLSPGGAMSVAETRDRVTRAVVFRERDGRVERTFTTNGAPVQGQEIADAVSWMHRVLQDVARESTVGVEKRVARVRARRGVPGVFDEIAQIASDGVKRAWFATLLDEPRLPNGDLREAALVAGRTIASDGDKASVLKKIADRAGDDPSVGMAVVTAASSIASDGDRRSVLARVTGGQAPSGAVLAYAVQAARGIASDGDKAAVLRGINARAADLSSVRAAIVDAASTIASDGDRANVLVDVLAAATDEATLVSALRSAHGIASDGERRRVLTAALPHTTLAGDRVRAAFFTTADNIASDGDHAEVLLAAVRRAELSSSAIPDVLRSAGHIASDGDKARVLMAVAARPHALDDPTVRAGFFGVLKTVSSSSDYRRVMEYVTR